MRLRRHGREPRQGGYTEAGRTRQTARQHEKGDGQRAQTDGVIRLACGTEHVVNSDGLDQRIDQG